MRERPTRTRWRLLCAALLALPCLASAENRGQSSLFPVESSGRETSRGKDHSDPGSAFAFRHHARMKTYLVGGAVRDRLLGLPPGDRDW
ncbi:MAG TPA: hypothetical protein PLF73_09130, partial [Luteimonas sp.]|nr:hypothetical protein [Luteimonas sp.]